MALDFAQMIKRTDVDYYVKERAATTGTEMATDGAGGRTQIREVTRSRSQRGARYTKRLPESYFAGSLRVTESNSTDPAYGRLCSMAKGLLWNALK